MTTTTGNICLILAALVSSLLYTSGFKLKPPGGNDEGATGYLMIVVVFIHLAFLFFMSIAAIAIARNGGFDWISHKAFTRNIFVGAGLLSAVILSISCALTRVSPDAVPDWAQKFMAVAYVAIPIVLIASGFVLLNGSLRASIPAFLYKWPLAALFAVSMVGAGVFLFGLMTEVRESAASRRAAIQDMEDSAHQDNLNYIDSCEVTKDFIYLMAYTHADRDADVREKAVAKIRSHPAWQQQLIYYLENQGASEVFTFLANNEVDDKSLLAEPVRKGVLSIADGIRKSISYKSHPSHASPQEFMPEVTLSLRTIKKFEGLGVDYLPAVIALRAALDEPSQAGKLQFDCVSDLDEWIKKHQ